MPSSSGGEEVFDRLAALGRHFPGGRGVLQRVEGGADHVVRVGRAMALGHDVGDAHHLEDGAHRAAGDDAGPLGGRGHHHAGRAVLAVHLVVQRAVLQRDLGHVAAGFFHRLLHGGGHFLGLALAHADAAVAVADHGERGEAEDTAALHHLGHAVHRDHLLAQAVFRTVTLTISLNLCHVA